MAIYGGPDIITDGLVLHLDAANPNCYVDEPTTNKINGLYSTTFANSGFTIVNNYATNFDGSNTASLLTAGSWIARTGGYSSTFTLGSTYTTTWILKNVNMNTVPVNWGGAHKGTKVFLSVDLVNGIVSSASDPSLYGIYSLGNGWYAVWYITTMTDGTAHFPQLSSGGAGLSILYGGMQVEEKSYPTTIVDGARGGTVATDGGLRDISGNNNNGTITRANVPATPFYSNNNKGLWTFDGTSDKVTRIPAPSRLENSCTEVWFKTNGNQSSSFSMIFGYEHIGGGYSRYITGPIALYQSNKIFSSVITSAEGYRTITSVKTINNNQFYHVCLNKDTVNGVLSIYINGQFDNSNTFDANTLSYWAGGYQGSNFLEIGGYYSTNNSIHIGTGYLNGSVSIAKMHNRLLTSEEILQNYNALKGRFGL